MDKITRVAVVVLFLLGTVDLWTLVYDVGGTPSVLITLVVVGAIVFKVLFLVSEMK